MAKYRKSKTDNKFFLDIPSPDEIDDEEWMDKKYQDKELIGINKCEKCGHYHKECEKCGGK